MYKIILFFSMTTAALFATAPDTVFSKYKNKVFVETGSHIGNGIQQALDAGFLEVHSIELSPKYYDICKKRFANNKHVILHQGDSEDILGTVIATIDQPITFWLDGHNSGGDTAKGKKMTPLIAELEQIKAHPIHTHTILIDDIRYLGTKAFESISLQDIVTLIMEINPNYQIILEDGFVKNDILVAFIPKTSNDNPYFSK